MTQLDLLLRRHSVRKFTPAEVAPEILKRLQAAITDINTHEAGMKFQIITDDPAPFSGFSRSYGMFSGVRNYIAAVVDTSYANYRERAGYFGMQLTMKAVELGLGTCFVGGTFSKSHIGARIRIGEKLLFLIVFGQEDSGSRQPFLASIAMKIAHRKKMNASEFLESSSSEEELAKQLPGLHDALAALAHCPSSLNKRPARLRVEKADNGDLKVEAYVAAGNPAQEIDLGIALYSIQAVMPGFWDWGNPALFHPDAQQ